MSQRLFIVWIGLLALLAGMVGLAHFFPAYAWLALIGSAGKWSCFSAASCVCRIIPRWCAFSRSVPASG